MSRGRKGIEMLSVYTDISFERTVKRSKRIVTGKRHEIKIKRGG